MTWKLYISYGMMKSGSTLAFKLTRTLLEHHGYQQDLLPDWIINGPRPANFVHDLTQEKLDGALAVVAQTGIPLVLKTHNPPTDAVVEMFQRGEAIGHATFRDPREIALSMFDHGKRIREAGGAEPFVDLAALEDTYPRIRRQIGFFDQWCDLPGVEPWFYDDFAWNKAGMLAQLEAQTGLKANATRLLLGFNDRKHMQFNRGVKTRWKDDMSAEQAAAFETEFADFFARFDQLRSTWRQGKPGLVAQALSRAGLR